MYAKASIITLFASLAAAQVHAPVGEPKGNPITRPLNEVVHTCEKFTITWQPTTPNKVSVLLLKGPSTNVVKFGPPLAEGIDNSGSLSWTPAADLEATEGPHGYGIQIIDDVTGQYQYSTQFGIEAGNCADKSKPESSAPAPTATSAAYQPGAGYGASTPVASNTPAPVASSSAPATQAPPYPTTVVTISSSVLPPYATANATVPAGSGTLPPSSSATGNATTSHLPEVTANAASGLQAGLGFFGAVAAAFAVML